MSRLDYCKYDLVGDCYDWKNDNCDRCNIFKAYCEGARMAMSSIVRCKDCKHQEHCHQTVSHTKIHDGFQEHWSETIEWCSRGERKGGDDE